MKNRKIKMIAVVLAAIMAFTSAAFAATDDGEFSSSTKNRQPYTPEHCTIQLYPSSIVFSNMKWDAGVSIFDSQVYWEGELRTIFGAGGNQYSAYSEVHSIDSNLPEYYKEFDPNDISIGTRTLAEVSPSSSYYAELATSSGFQYDAGVELYFESEIGTWLVFDGWPTNCQAFSTRLDTALRPRISW